MKSYRNFELKGQVLRVLMQHGDMTSAEIDEYVRYRGDKHSYYGYIYQLTRRGFISKTNNKKPYIYTTTAKGREHADNPFISLQRRQEAVQRKVQAILEDEESFQQAVEQAVNDRIGNGGAVSGGHGGPIASPTASVNDENVISMIRAKDKEITMLQMQLQELRRQSQGPTGQVRAQTQRERTPEEVKEERIRIKRRRKLAEMYAGRNMLLDAAFFVKWGDLRPYKFKFKKWLSDNSIEIMSKNNPEIRRGHAHRQPLPPQAIIQCQFHIVKMDEKGITITGRGLPDGKARMSF